MRVMCRASRLSVARATAYLKSVPLPDCIEPSISIMDLTPEPLNSLYSEKL